MLITLPLPPKELSPNARPHHMAKAKKKREYRQLAAVLATNELDSSCPWKSATVRIRWYHKTMRFPDKDNALGWLKCAWDGLEDAGVVENDRDMTYLPVEMAKDKNNPRVEIEVQEDGPHTSQDE